MVFDQSTKQAAVRLGRLLSGRPWYSSVGIQHEHGRTVLVVYLRHRLPKPSALIPKSWDGLEVRVKPLGKTMPA